MPVEQDIVLNTGDQAIINTRSTQIFLFNNVSAEGDIGNSTYDPITYPIGTVLGRQSSNGRLKPFVASASDGSQYPIGILRDDYTVVDGDVRAVYYCNGGDVAAELLVFQGSDTLESTVANAGGRRVKDLLQSEGVRVIYATNVSGDFDNQ